MNLQDIQQQAQGMATQPIMPNHPMVIPGGHPMPPQMSPQQQSGNLPPPPVLMQLAQEAKALDPMMLGAIIFHALKQGGEPLNSQGITSLGQ